ncbi:nucleoside hydrolase-like isoform X2 [Cylas formicarius]|uniref:nucleoside hydrolase-like isoform X2 n=1 Tax=Cylas formicarius TaxID=197179 RepID=UPI0029583A4A|nr:nucleoside hydrolase-like isoform X2 [Cylas formicarius]
MVSRRVIVDVDTGVDDYLALLILFYAEKLNLIKIEAITCTYGNTSLNNVCKNTLRLLEILQRRDIPVLKGCDDQALIPHERNLPTYFGADGFGMCDIVLKHRNKVSIICLGPLTNLAVALRLYSSFASNIRDIWIMGGNYSGNESNYSVKPEFNFGTDPEAAHIVLKCAKCPIYLLPWETCLKQSVTMEWRNTLHCSNLAMELLTKAEKQVINESEMYYLPCDAFLTFAFLNAEKHVSDIIAHSAAVEVRDDSKRGQVIIQDNKVAESKNVLFITGINEKLFKKFIEELDQEL